jgi:hypothetical protein
MGKIARTTDSRPANLHLAAKGLCSNAGAFGLVRLSDYEILEREFIVYDALYAECKRRVSHGLVAEVR